MRVTAFSYAILFSQGGISRSAFGDLEQRAFDRHFPYPEGSGKIYWDLADDGIFALLKNMYTTLLMSTV
jgi:hypothetical protein